MKGYQLEFLLIVIVIIISLVILLLMAAPLFKVDPTSFSPV